MIALNLSRLLNPWTLGQGSTEVVSVPIPSGIVKGSEATLIPVSVPGVKLGDLIISTSPQNMISYLPDGIPTVVGAEVSADDEITFGIINVGALSTGAGNLGVVVTWQRQ